DPVEISVAANNATADTVTQIAYQMSSEEKRAAVVHLVKSKGLNQVIVFSNTKIGTGRLARQLIQDGVKAESIHGDKSQADRMKALEAFKAGELEVLVATDVAARGLDVAGVPCVINYDLPYNAEDYVHRIGRTGRAGASGEAINFCSPDDARLLADIEKLIGRKIPRSELQLPAAPRRARSEPSAARNSGGYSRSVKQPVDDFFFKPYEPSTPPSSAPSQAAAKDAQDRAAERRRSVGVLLGG
ncbi:MAG TPA: DEAD/DEAH box helicase, partial [Burkholderiaceae bacterium]|nr:DEAD/DEAH box helicase [Burkholderiaceae bacterium]